MEQILLKDISRQTEDRTTGNSQIRSTKGSLYVSNFIVNSDQITSTADEERAVNVILLYFSKTPVVSHSFFAAKLRRCRLDMQTKSCGEKNSWTIGIKE